MKLVFGDPNKKELKVCQGYVDKINALEPEISGLSDARLCAKTQEFRLRLTKGETLDDLLPELGGKDGTLKTTVSLPCAITPPRWR